MGRGDSALALQVEERGEERGKGGGDGERFLRDVEGCECEGLAVSTGGLIDFDEEAAVDGLEGGVDLEDAVVMVESLEGLRGLVDDVPI